MDVKGSTKDMKDVNAVIATTQCYDCGSTMEGRKGRYKYIESGLNSVYLNDILVFHCKSCNALVPEIPAAGVLHRVIALRILSKETLLKGTELRFLRKLCGYSVNEFAEIMGSSKTVVSRWENQDTLSKGTDRTVRLLVMAKLTRELTGIPEPILKNVTAEQLNADLEKALKVIEARKATDKYEISPEEIARFAGSTEEPFEAMTAVH